MAGIPPYSPVDLVIDDQFADLTILCQGKCFHIQVSINDIHGTHTGPGSLEEEILNFQENMDDPVAMETLENLILAPCASHIRQLAPARQSQPISLIECFNPPTFTFNLVNVNGHLEAVQQPEAPHDFVPKLPMSNQTIPVTIISQLPCIPASSIETIPKQDAFDEEYDSSPKEVRVHGTQQQMVFKPAFDEEFFKRELEALLTIQKTSSVHDLNVPKFTGIVAWDDGLAIMGLLVESIPDSRPLDEMAFDAAEDSHEKWVQQIQNIVQRLHDINLTWGSAKPDSVSIDLNGNVWLTNFGGGSDGYIDEELEGTKEGDLQGISRINEFLNSFAAGQLEC